MTLVNFLDGIEFSGLSTGPQNLEDGAYAEMLFATDTDGMLYALDTDGVMQPVFFNGSTSINTAIPGLAGLAFSTLDYNLWHITDESRERRRPRGQHLAGQYSPSTELLSHRRRNELLVRPGRGRSRGRHQLHLWSQCQ